jgi:2-keto-4-pentenoate hydratase/2-oxohepta-3-ene-1,7-dioic acid hydratase in catechol pathway
MACPGRNYIMKLIRFALGGRVQHGSLEGDQIQPLEGELHALTAVPGAKAIPLGSVKLLSPTAASKVVAIGPGRRGVLGAGAAPPERPTLFFKPSTAVNNPEDPIIFPPELDYLNHEGEIGIVIGRLARRVKRESAAAHILGYTCVNDVTAGELRKIVGTPMMFHAKAFDTFAPFGPVVVTDIDPSNLDTECRVNGEVRVKARTDDLIYSPDFLVSWISHVMTLLPGDVISTGAPGVGPLKPGDVVEVEIEGIGCLRNPVIAGD